MSASLKLSEGFSERELRETNELLERFVYSCSHDLKGPLASIKGLLQLAEVTDSKEAQTEYLTLINESITRMDTFLKSLESYIGNARGPVLRNSIDFDNLTRDILNKYKNIIAKRNVKINLRVRQPIPFKSDDIRVGLILKNIIENAIYFQDLTKSERFVDIEISVSEMHVRIEICDNGEGICRENMDKIYKMFFRASEASKGSGLGLYLAQEAIKKLNGTVKAVSSQGVGTNFIINIPNTYVMS